MIDYPAPERQYTPAGNGVRLQHRHRRPAGGGEAALTCELMGNRVERIYDTGVAGIHRILDQTEKLARSNVVIVVAGMEGALPSVVGGLVDKPVIAVPASVGYGASFNGLAALLGMLNMCFRGYGGKH